MRAWRLVGRAQQRRARRQRRELVGDEREREATGHHQHQPKSRHCRKDEHHLGPDHSRQRQPEAEQRAGDHGERSPHSWPHPSIARPCAVAKPVAMKVSTASSDGSFSEPIPQMPWPEVQPPAGRTEAGDEPAGASRRAGTAVQAVGGPERKSTTAPRRSPGRAQAAAARRGSRASVAAGTPAASTRTTSSN